MDKKNVAFFCDNDIQKQGEFINGVKVISFEEMVRMYCDKYIIMITPVSPLFLIGQLENANIKDYLLYHDNEPRIVKYDNVENSEEKEHNDFLRKYVKKSYLLNIFNKIDDFKTVVEEAIYESKEKGMNLNYYTRGEEEEGYRYGNLQVLERYAGVQRKDGEYAPVVSHQDSLPIYSPIHSYKTSVIFSGDYYKEKIHKVAPWVPIYTVGPYIHYAKEIYTKQEMAMRKQQIGKMLLAFLPHTLENTKRCFSREAFLREIKKIYGNQFEQIWLCAYFTDINDELCEYAKELGLHVVSAGFRFDPAFDDRLKTIIEFSDAIVCGDIGSFLGYAMYLEKPIARIDITDKTSLLDVQYSRDLERDIQKTDDCVKFESDFYRLFNEEIKLNINQKLWMNSLAGFNQIKNRDYIKKIFDISADIWNECGGNYRCYPDAVRKIFYAYNQKGDYRKMHILKQAVGNFLE